MDLKDQSYIDALTIVLDGGKLSLAASAAPLAIISAQVGFLTEIESVWLKVFTTLTIIIFAISAYASLAFVVSCRMVIAKEKLSLHGDPEKGLKMLNFIESKVLRGRFSLDEDYIIYVTKTHSVPAAWLLAPGWILMIVTLVMAVWQ